MPRRDEAIAAFSTMPLLGHEAGIEQDAEVLRDGWAAHLEMSRKRVDVQPPLSLAKSCGGPFAFRRDKPRARVLFDLFLGWPNSS